MAVEFVVMFPILLALMLGMVEFGRFYNASITVTHASREAVRVVALCSTGSCNGAAHTAANTAASPLSLQGGSPETDCPLSGVGNASFTATASFTWDPLLSFVPGLPASISRSAVMRCGG